MSYPNIRNMKEGYDPIRDAENVVEEAFTQAENKEHQVTLPLNVVLRLHDELLHSQGIYIYPEEADELTEEEWEKRRDKQNASCCSKTAGRLTYRFYWKAANYAERWNGDCVRES